MALVFLTFGLYSQSIVGGAGVCAVDQDPDNITAMQTQDERFECLVAWDNTNQALYVYDDGATVGNRWTSVPLSTVTDTDTRLDNPRVTAGNLVFDLYDETTDTDIGDISVPVADIAPIQNVAAGTGISVNIVGGTATVTNTAPANSTDELQNLTASFPNATTANVNLSNGGGSISIVEGTSINVQDDGSGNVEIINTAPDQTVGLTGGTGITVSGTYPNFTVSNSSPGNGTDELQDLTLTGNDLSLTSSAVDIDLSPYLDNTDAQSLSITGNTLSLTNGGSVSVDGDATNEAQTISAAFPTASTATWSLDQVSGQGGGTITIEEGDGIDIANNGGNIQVTSEDFAAVSADDHADAGVQGVAIGEYFYTTSGNTMGVPAGTKVRRAY